MARAFVSIILAAILLAGCMQSDKPTPSSTPSPTSTTSDTGTTTADRTSTSAPTQTSTPELPLEAFLSGCTSWTTLVGGPTELFGGPLPDGWEPESPPAFQLMQFNECERLSWGAFERGPVHLVFEFSEEFIAPPECERGDFGRSHILRALWIDDAEIGAWLALTYGMPVRVATIDVAREGSGAILESWTWSEGQDAPSEMHFQYSIPRADPTTYVHRLYWFDQDSTSYMDFSESYSFDDNAVRAAEGLLQEPTIYASWTGVSEYAAAADRSIDLETAISIALFDDFTCNVS